MLWSKKYKTVKTGNSFQKVPAKVNQQKHQHFELDIAHQIIISVDTFDTVDIHIFTLSFFFNFIDQFIKFLVKLTYKTQDLGVTTSATCELTVDNHAKEYSLLPSLED